jgi:ABC-type multidrug transport system ATPase subunit|mmetsp:Transcript_27850/g.37210  ORF Transcript_27850/g.37210 Transcript_27850/m.37210 type:complete len:132 (+) Transcript_27850:4302-4697(+)
MLYETAAHGSYVGSIYFHDNYTRGKYTTKGVSFSLEHTERFVILDACKNGAEDLFAAIAGQKVPLCGNMVINGLCGDDLVSNYTKLHGIIGFQPQYDAVDENLTVHQHLTIFAGIAGIPRSECETHVLKMI